MNSSERILTTLRGGIPDRVGRLDSIWPSTVERWKTEGLEDGQDVCELFGFDFHGLPWYDLSLRLPTEVMEDTDEYILHRDANGVTRKDFKGGDGHTPQWLGHTVKTARDWYEYKQRLVFEEARLSDQCRESYEAGRAREKFVFLQGLEPYEAAWPVFGQVNLFTLMMDDPKAAADVFMTYADLICQCAQSVLDMGLDYDGVWYYGDVGYRNGLLFSPDCYDQLLFPAHKKICRFCADHGKPVILHSCGKIKSLIPRFIEAGFAAIQPLEAKCDQDVRELKELYRGKITLFGNIDIRALSGSREDVEQEVRSKLAVAAEGGGYIFHSDHSVPPTVSFDNYRYAVELVAKYGAY